MIVKESSTPFEALSKLREKYSVKKIREDFDKLDSEWNAFKVTEVSTDPDLIFKTLEEQSRKLAVFGEHYKKDSLQILSKLACSLPSEYNHVFTYLNTNEERLKTFDEQLVTANSMITRYFKTKIQQEDKPSSSMIFMMSGDGKNYNNNRVKLKCDFCGKDNHTAYRNGKPFCFKLKRKLRKEKLQENSSANENDINSLFIHCIQTSTIKKDQETTKTLWLGDTGAQCHVICANDNDFGITKSNINMGNKSSSDVIRYEYVTIRNDSGHHLLLKNTRVLKGMVTNVISLFQLV